MRMEEYFGVERSENFPVEIWDYISQSYSYMELFDFIMKHSQGVIMVVGSAFGLLETVIAKVNDTRRVVRVFGTDYNKVVVDVADELALRNGVFNAHFSVLDDSSLAAMPNEFADTMILFGIEKMTTNTERKDLLSKVADKCHRGGRVILVAPDEGVIEEGCGLLDFKRSDFAREAIGIGTPYQYERIGIFQVVVVTKSKRT